MALRQSFARTAALLLSIAQTRLTLFSLELDEQKGQVVGLLALGLATAAFAVLAVLVASLAIVLHFWPTAHRSLALLLLALGYVLLSGGLFMLLRHRMAQALPAFAASRQALQEDAALLRQLARGGVGSADDGGDDLGGLS